MLPKQSKISDFFRRLAELPFLEGNSLSVNMLLVLSAAAFVIIAVDLESDLAVQKDEISQVVTVLTDSEDTLGPLPSADLILEPPLSGLLPAERFLFVNEKPAAIESDRAPPVTA